MWESVRAGLPTTDPSVRTYTLPGLPSLDAGPTLQPRARCFFPFEEVVGTAVRVSGQARRPSLPADRRRCRRTATAPEPTATAGHYHKPDNPPRPHYPRCLTVPAKSAVNTLTCLSVWQDRCGAEHCRAEKEPVVALYGFEPGGAGCLPGCPARITGKALPAAPGRPTARSRRVYADIMKRCRATYRGTSRTWQDEAAFPARAAPRTAPRTVERVPAVLRLIAEGRRGDG